MYRKFALLLIILSLGCAQDRQYSSPGENKANISLDSITAQKTEYIPQAGIPGGTLALATISDPKSFNPIVAKETSTSEITGLIFEGLTRVDAVTLEVVPLLAQSWTVSQDGFTFTFCLRNDVFWQDGHKFGADDVVFTFNDLIYNPKIPTSARDIFTIEGEPFKVEKIDDYNVKFILPARFAPFLMGMSQEIMPKHILEDSLKQGKFNYTWGISTPLSEIVGTGPFKLTGYLPGQKVILEKNPLYWKKNAAGQRLPYIDKIVYLIVQSSDTALLKFQEGEIDYYGMRGDDYPVLKPKEKEGNFTVFNSGPAFGENFLLFNQNTDINSETKKPFVDQTKLSWFRNKGFRQAVSYAIDRKSMINIVLNGLGSAQYSAMSPSSGLFHNPNVKKYEYDLEKARSLLKNEGFVLQDGLLKDSDGNQVEFNLYTNSGNTERIKIAQIIRKDLENLGMKVNFLPLEFNLLVSKLESTYDWEAMVLGLTGGIEPHFGANVWRSSGHLHLWYPRQKSPSAEWERQIDEIFNQGVQEMDRSKRKLLYDEWQVIVADNLPLIYTALPLNIFAVRNKFGNLYPTSYGGAFHNLEEIYIKSRNQ